ncbi:N-acetylmuramate alpha-1-phosphate uridylyltransferase MurU [Lysobacter sp. A03]|uniref:N-acetylmuramate alpha-1-phosphate uridylyltransferase MurU n=1 Tax=Lysobacter sp. A03 TaxID=1199154 RepID=UPI0005B73BF6|nr:nucleotidyltransferase family protein [Lysobacter sp. A03]KIQ97066.1 Glucose-1-phosphate thymidylyltransferase [Lysobacter sp. A03]
MKALVLAAGRGERMRPLTDSVPKPLLGVGGKPLIVWHLERLAGIGVREVVINTSWLAEQFEPALGDGRQWGLKLHYSYEGAEPLETGGGMLHALDFLGHEIPFITVNGDVWSDFDLALLPREPTGEAHLVLVDNPEHNPEGDFSLGRAGVLSMDDPNRQTFAGIGVYRPSLLADWNAVIGASDVAVDTRPRFPLAPLLRHAMRTGAVTGEHHRGRWTDVGTPQRLAELDASLSRSAPDAGMAR